MAELKTPSGFTPDDPGASTLANPLKGFKAMDEWAQVLRSQRRALSGAAKALGYPPMPPITGTGSEGVVGFDVEALEAWRDEAEQWTERFPARALLYASIEQWTAEVTAPRGFNNDPLTPAEMTGRLGLGATSYLDAGELTMVNNLVPTRQFEWPTKMAALAVEGRQLIEQVESTGGVKLGGGQLGTQMSWTTMLLIALGIGGAWYVLKEDDDDDGGE